MSTTIASSLEEFAREQGAASCSAGLTINPWRFDKQPSYGPGASERDALPAHYPVQPAIPASYREASPDELEERIIAAKQRLAERLVILGHFYQRDEVVRHADYVGDSFQLARAALAHPRAEAIVFCGVHFMAETADILSRPEQKVLLPNLGAGCSMADMADLASVEACWAALRDVYATHEDASAKAAVIPVTYMNSSAALKAFCGRHGGIVCTSSNAASVLQWAFTQGHRVLFFPDQHLGRNTARAMGIPLSQMPLWDPSQPLGGNTPDTLHQARVILWHGYCSVHKRFNVAQITSARRHFPTARVIVHPECPLDIVEAADESGSTDYIQKAVKAAPAGSVFAIGTEINMVQRLAKQYPQHTIFCLDPVVCPCSTMYRIHPAYLAWVLEALVAGKAPNRIRVDGKTKAEAHVALERMLNSQP